MSNAAKDTAVEHRQDVYRAAFNLRVALHSDQSFYSALLFRMMMKADPFHLIRLSMGYPIEVGIYKEWRDTPNEADFWRKYNIPTKGG